MPRPSINLKISEPTPLEKQQVFIIGAAKSATTSLYRVLAEHPDICFPVKKEPGFFAENDEYNKGITYYQNMFPAEAQALIDGSTQYSRYTEYPGVPERIFRHYPNAKFIYVMRHPIDRAFSQYVHRWTKEKFPGKPITQTFDEFIENDSVPIDDSMYQKQIEQYLAFFPIERFLFLLTEDIHQDLQREVDKVCKHIGIADFQVKPDKKEVRENTSSQHREHQLRNNLKSNIALYSVSRLFPPALRHWLYEKVVRRTPLARNRASLFTPQPMRDETRRELAKHFSETTAWVEQTLSRQLPHWYK